MPGGKAHKHGYSLFVRSQQRVTIWLPPAFPLLVFKKWQLPCHVRGDCPCSSNRTCFFSFSNL